jgi:hypothetical protein
VPFLVVGFLVLECQSSGLQFARGANEDVLEKSLGDEFQRLLMLRTCAMGGLYNFVRHCGDMLDEEVM